LRRRVLRVDGQRSLGDPIRLAFVAPFEGEAYTAVGDETATCDSQMFYGAGDANTVLRFMPLTADGTGMVYAMNVYYSGPVVNNWSEGLWPHAWMMGTPVPFESF